MLVRGSRIRLSFSSKTKRFLFKESLCVEARDQSMPESFRKPNEALRRAREERGWTQSEAADALGCSLEAVQSWERGRRSRPGPRWRAKLCEVYQRSPEELGLTREPLRTAPSPARPEASVPSGPLASPEALCGRMDEQESPSGPLTLPGSSISLEV